MNPSSEGQLPAWLCNFTSLAIFTFDTAGKIIDKSDAFKEIFSQDNDLLFSIDSIFEKDDAEKLITATKTVLLTGNKTHIVVLHDKRKNMYTCECTLVKHCDELKNIFAAIITKDKEI